MSDESIKHEGAEQMSDSANAAFVQQEQQQQQQQSLTEGQQPQQAQGDSTQAMDPVALQLQQLEEERRRLEELQAEVDMEEDEHKEGKEEVDARSIYVGNVEYAASPEDLEKHFQPAGAINRVNIMLNKITGQPKGFAYIEFAEPAMVAEALLLNGTEFYGRQLKVLPKRTNIPGMARGRGGRGRGRGGMRGGRGRGYRGFRGRGRGYNPY